MSAKPRPLPACGRFGHFWVGSGCVSPANKSMQVRLGKWIKQSNWAPLRLKRFADADVEAKGKKSPGEAKSQENKAHFRTRVNHIWLSAAFEH